jgi:hypothetical protein
MYAWEWYVDRWEFEKAMLLAKWVMQYKPVSTS